MLPWTDLYCSTYTHLPSSVPPNLTAITECTSKLDLVPESHSRSSEPVIFRHGDVSRRSRAPLLRSHGRGGERDAVPGRRRQGLGRAGRHHRALQHLGRQDAVPDRRPAPVRVPEGDGLGAPGGPGHLQRVQHHGLHHQVRRRQHRVHARPLRPLLLHQRQPAQLRGQPEAHRRRARRKPHPAGPRADSPLLHAAHLRRAGAQPVFLVAAVSSFHDATLCRADAKPLFVATFHVPAVCRADAQPLILASVHVPAVCHADAEPDVATFRRTHADPGIRAVPDRFCSSRWRSRITSGYPRLITAFVFPWHPWRRAAAAGRHDQPAGRRRGELDHAGQRRCSLDGGGPDQHARSGLWVRLAGCLSALFVCVSVNCEIITYTVQRIYLCGICFTMLSFFRVPFVQKQISSELEAI